MWQYTQGLGFTLTDYRMSDVASSYVASVLDNELRTLRDIDASMSDDELANALDQHRIGNRAVMLNLVPQAPRGLKPTDALSWDMDNLLSYIDGMTLRLPAVVALGSYAARSAVESVHLVAALRPGVRQRYAHLVHTLHKLLRPHKREWLARAREMVTTDPRLRALESSVHFAQDPASRRYVFLVRDAAFRRAALRDSP